LRLIVAYNALIDGIDRTEEQMIAVDVQAFPSDERRRYSELIAKRQDECLTDDEYDELLRLSDRSEAHNAARIAALIDLAQERGVTLADLLASHDIPPRSDS
jgi:hypothetical protein